MAGLKPGEVSEIIKQQLKEISTETHLEEIGSVIQVGDGIARVYGLTNVQSNEMIEFQNGVKGIVLNLEEDNVGAVLLGPTEGIKEGDTVKRLNTITSIDVGEALLGRVVNTLGEPIDAKGQLKANFTECLLNEKPPV